MVVLVLLTGAQTHAWIPQAASWTRLSTGSAPELVVFLILTSLRSSLRYQKESELCSIPGPLPQQLPLSKSGRFTLTEVGQPLLIWLRQHRPNLLLDVNIYCTHSYVSSMCRHEEHKKGYTPFSQDVHSLVKETHLELGAFRKSGRSQSITKT